MGRFISLGVHRFLRDAGVALLVWVVIVSAASADQTAAPYVGTTVGPRNPTYEGQTPPPPPKPAAIKSKMDTDIATCKARGGVVGRAAAGNAVCIKAKMTSDQYKQQQGVQATQPQPAPAPTYNGSTVGPRNPTYETPAPTPPQPTTPAPTPEAEAGGSSGGVTSEPWFWAAIVGGAALTVAVVAAAASAAGGGTSDNCTDNECLPSVFAGNPCECATKTGLQCPSSGGGGLGADCSLTACASGFYCNGYTSTCQTGC